MTTKLDNADIQGIVLSGYAHLNEATYLFLKVDSGEKGRQWLKQISADISSAAPWLRGIDNRAIKPSTQVNIAFTHAGLEALGLPKDSLDSFLEEFCEGPLGEERSKLMGDVDESAPENWELGGPNTQPIHIMLMLFAATDESLEALQEHYEVTLREIGGITIVHDQAASRLDDSKEHFGFRDGVSQPAIEGALNPPTPGQDVIKAGEFVLGYRNEYDLIPPMPKPDVLGKNGTYLVYRKLAQNVGTFRQFLNEAANGDPQLVELIGAKLMGRWKSGAPLALTPDGDDPQLGQDNQRNNNFRFAETDPYGYRTPIGSHVRRSNPRDGIEHDPTASVQTAGRHRILRRGRPYGPPFNEQTANEARGTLFVAINADIKRQFEFVQQRWVNDAKFAGLYSDPDPMAGDHSNGNSTMTIQHWPIRKEIRGVPRFVTVKASVYFFVPSLTALAFIANGG
ncbi:MAG: Dyp-type peroxidase [Chloroflexota bacterium]